MKQAMFLAIDNGIEGKGPDSIRFASTIEAKRDKFIEDSPNKNWLRKSNKVCDLSQIAFSTWNALDGLQQLALQVNSEHFIYIK